MRSTRTDLITLSMDDDRLDYLQYRLGMGGTVEIVDIKVRSQREAGRGRALVEEMVEQLPAGAKLIYAFCRADNMVGRHFWEAMGFRVMADLIDFYQDDGLMGAPDAILYGRDI